jgi:hypothetical protein
MATVRNDVKVVLRVREQYGMRKIIDRPLDIRPVERSGGERTTLHTLVLVVSLLLLGLSTGYKIGRDLALLDVCGETLCGK